MFRAIIDVGSAATGPGPCKEPVNKVKQNNGDSKQTTLNSNYKIWKTWPRRSECCLGVKVWPPRRLSS